MTAKCQICGGENSQYCSACMGCRCCGDEFFVPPHLEPTDYCHECAQILVIELLDACVELRLVINDIGYLIGQANAKRRLRDARDAIDRIITKARPPE